MEIEAWKIFFVWIFRETECGGNVVDDSRLHGGKKQQIECRVYLKNWAQLKQNYNLALFSSLYQSSVAHKSAKDFAASCWAKRKKLICGGNGLH